MWTGSPVATASVAKIRRKSCGVNRSGFTVRAHQAGEGSGPIFLDEGHEATDRRVWWFTT